ncbi:MAG: GNAT family N-acetyltransferase [Paracoccaceae bacterium]
MDFRIDELSLNHNTQIVEIWHQGWHDAHASLVPSELVVLRTKESFTDRVQQLQSDFRVAISKDEILGFCILRGDELYQMYVSRNARGRGVAAALIEDAETCIQGAGHRTAWLDCAIGNDRAARFYGKSGWENVKTVITKLDTSKGHFPLEVWRFEKSLP